MLPPFKKSPIKNLSVWCTPPFEKSLIKKPLVLCTPPFEKLLFLVDAYFGVGVYFGKYGMIFNTTFFKSIPPPPGILHIVLSVFGEGRSAVAFRGWLQCHLETEWWRSQSTKTETECSGNLYRVGQSLLDRLKILEFCFLQPKILYRTASPTKRYQCNVLQSA